MDAITITTNPTEYQPQVPIQVRTLAPAEVRYCRECGQPYHPSRHDQEFCRPHCRQTHHKRRYERGAILYDFAMKWRGKRTKGGFTEFCQMVDEWLRAERHRRLQHKGIKEAHKKQQKGN